MRKLKWVVLIAFLVIPIVPPDLCAYQIEVEETSAYEFINGADMSRGETATIVYEINEEEGSISEVLLAPSNNEAVKSIYLLGDRGDGNIMGMRAWEQGEAMMAFQVDGTFYHYQMLRLPYGNVATFHFGKYKKLVMH